MAQRPRRAKRARTIDEWRNGTESGLTVPGVQGCVIEIPMAVEINLDLYTSKHVEVQLARSEALALRRLREGLQSVGATLDNGKKIIGNADVIRHILQMVPKMEDG